MAIKTIKVSNFKSFKNLDVELGSFNVLIGANASGKSNFIQVFRFLHDIEDSGLDNAISMQGGAEFLHNISVGESQATKIEVSSNDVKYPFHIRRDLFIKALKTTYKLCLQFKKNNTTMTNDEFIHNGILLEIVRKNKEQPKRKDLGPGTFSISNVGGKLSFDLKSQKIISVNQEDFFPRFLSRKQIIPKNLLLESKFFSSFMKNDFSHVTIYDFDPKLPKKAVPITGKVDLEENGENLALALKNIISDKNKNRKFSNLIRDLLPFVKGVDVERFADKSLLFNLREKYFDKQTLPASLISDGTVNLTAMILALYFEENPITIIEEPERNIHPHLISKVVEMMKDASKNKQIIVTTHNPEVVKHAGLDNILLVSRDENGFSTISKPADKKEVKIFLKNELGIDELYIQNLLEV